MSNQILLKPSLIACVLGAGAFLLVLASIGVTLFVHVTQDHHDSAVVRFFYLDAEKNAPTGFSTLLLLFAALVLSIVMKLERQNGRSSFYWSILSLGFLFMAVDEAFTLHERLTHPVRVLLDREELGIFFSAWVIPGIILVLVLALFFLRFLIRLPRKTRSAFLLAATIYLGGAIGFELIGGRLAELHGRTNLTYNMIMTLEESLEMAGVIVFIWALLVHIANTYKEVRLQLTDVA